MSAAPSQAAVSAVAAFGLVLGGVVAVVQSGPSRPAADMSAGGLSPFGSALHTPALRVLGPALLDEVTGGGLNARSPFVGPGGLTRAGEVAMRWLRDATYHGWPDLAVVGEKIGDQVRGLPRRVVLRLSAPDPDRLHAAWLKGGKAAVREMVAAAAAGQGEPEAGDRAERERRAELDRGVGEALARLAAAIAPQPRQEAILKRKKRRGQTAEYLGPEALWADREAPPAPADLLDQTRRVAADGPAALRAWLRERQPAYPALGPQYERLVAAARSLDKVCASGGWETVSVPAERKRVEKKRKLPNGKVRTQTELTPWVPPSGELVAAVQHRLARESFYEGAPSGGWDEATEAATRAYQAARNVRGSGVFDAATAQAMNVPCDARVAQVVLNVERWRYSAIADRATYLFVNVPGFEATYVRDGVPRRRQRAVVGKTRSSRDRELRRRIYPSATPILTDAITTIIINPDWTGSARLVRHELGRGEAYDPGPAEDQGQDVRKIAADGEGSGRARVWGGPLGEVRLDLTNGDDIFLHDSPDKWAFDRNLRAYTNGSVWLDQALEVAAAILSDDAALGGRPFSTPELLTFASSDDRRRKVPLNEPVTTIFEYYTASVDDDGRLRLHPDLYGYDAAYFEERASESEPEPEPSTAEP